MAVTPRNGYDVLLKIMSIGDSGVGKTSILQRFVDDKFSPTFMTTVGIDFKSKTVVLPAKGNPSKSVRAKLMLWDTAGQERFRTMTSTYFRGAQAVLLVFDVTDRASFEAVEKWAKQVTDVAGEKVPLVLIGNKMDVADTCKRRVQVEWWEAEALAGKIRAPFFRVSAKTNTGVTEAVMAAATLALASSSNAASPFGEQHAGLSCLKGSEHGDSGGGGASCSGRFPC